MEATAQPATATEEKVAKRVIVSEDLPLTVLTAVATTMVMQALHLDTSLLYVGVAMSPLVADVIKNAFRGLRKRWLSLLAALLVLLGTAGRARAARLRARQDHAVGARAMVSTAAVSAALTVALFTAFEIGSGNATIFFGPHRNLATDRTPPHLNVPAGILVHAPGRTVVVRYRVSARDRIDGAVTARCAPRSGALFAVGNTIVRCSATDLHGNRAVRSFRVSVRRAAGGVAPVQPKPVPTRPAAAAKDVLAPTLSLPGDQDLKTADAGGRIFVFAATADDRVDGAVRASCKPASGSQFPIGTTTVKCVAADAHGNRATGSFAVTVELSKQRDTTAPVLMLPPPVNGEATSPDGAVVTYKAFATDGVDGSVAMSCLPASGSTFPVGTTRVRCSAHDAARNPATGGFAVTVTDTTAPTLAPLADVTAEAISSYGATVDFKPTATDIVDGDVVPACNWSPGQAFPLGVTQVSCTAKDARGNTTSEGFSVTVADTTAPAIKVLGELTVEATSARGAAVRYTVSATDIVSGTVPVTCSRQAGTFALGQTAVTCSATDARGNRGTASFAVNVVDRTPPKVYVPASFTLDIGYDHGTTINYTATAIDTVDGRLTPTCSIPSGTWVAVSGTTTKTITCTAVDSHGNKGTSSFNVTIKVSVIG